METGIKAKDIMKQDFPLIDSSLTLETCMRKLNNKHETCAVLHDGFLNSIISYDELLKAFLKRKIKNLKIKDIARKNFVVVKPETDVLEIIKIMTKTNIDLILVKDETSLGLITKKEIAEINQLLFDMLARKEESLLKS